VEEVWADRVNIRMKQGGLLGAHKGINLPGIPISAPSMTLKDQQDLEVGVGSGVDYVALSFVRSAQDIRGIKERLKALGHPEIPVVAKIEKPEAVEHIGEILEVTDAIMVARGDLGVELPLESLPIHQKGLIRAANRAGVLVITATQMLDSMERNPRPTRAETTDVANAILDGTDAVMLSGETAVGSFPIESLRVMNRIAIEAEQSAFFSRPGDEDLPPVSASSHSVARAACLSIAEYPRPLVVFTWSGHSALVASKYRPPGRIFALTPSATVCDRLALVWGVTPVLVDAVETTDELINHGERVLMDAGHLKKGDQVVVLAGTSPMKGATNLMKIYRIGDN
jgi:pyruvate kinase